MKFSAPTVCRCFAMPSPISFLREPTKVPMLVKRLLFLENRDLDRPAGPGRIPLLSGIYRKASFFYLGSKLHLGIPVQGGSTLAVQLEKFRHSLNGRTDTPAEKLRQLIGASLKAYRAGKIRAPGASALLWTISIPCPSPQHQDMERSMGSVKGFMLGSECT